MISPEANAIAHTIDKQKKSFNLVMVTPTIDRSNVLNRGQRIWNAKSVKRPVMNA